MDRRKTAPQEFTVKKFTKQSECDRLVGQSITVGDKEFFAGNFREQRFAVNDQSAFVLKVIGKPDVVIADEKIDRNTRIADLVQFSQQSREPSGNHRLVLEPVIEDYLPAGRWPAHLFWRNPTICTASVPY
jgi:hypothetical protein